MKLILILALSAVNGTGTTAADYYRRALHAAKPEKRIELLDKALEINPNYVPALRHRAAVLSILGKKKLALADAVRAAELSPGDPHVNYTAAAIAGELKEHALAARLYGRALALRRKDMILRARKVQALIKLRRVGEALKDADYLVERRPRENFPYALRADVYEWADRYAEAVADLTVLIRRRPDESQYYLQRCINYRCMGDGQKALADAQKAMQLKGNTAYIYAARGCSYEVLGDLKSALEDYKKAADLDDEKRYFTIWSCIILRKLGKRTEADKFINEFLKTHKEDKWIAPVIKYLAGKMTEAEVFKLARHKDPEKQREQLCEAYYYVGACHLADKKLDAAEKLFRKCLAQRVNNFYEHGFAIRDLRTIKKLREKKEKANKGSD